MPLCSGGIFVCRLYLRENKYDYWILNLVIDTEAATGGIVTATRRLSA